MTLWIDGGTCPTCGAVRYITDEDILDNIIIKERNQDLEDCLRRILSPREYDMISIAFGLRYIDSDKPISLYQRRPLLFKELTLEQLSIEFGLTRERCRVILAVALRKLPKDVKFQQRFSE